MACSLSVPLGSSGCEDNCSTFIRRHSVLSLKTGFRLCMYADSETCHTQGLAFATVSGIPILYGLYMVWAPPFFYSLFGVSIHVSYGPFALVGLFISDALRIRGYQPCAGLCRGEPEETKVSCCSACCRWCLTPERIVVCCACCCLVVIAFLLQRL